MKKLSPKKIISPFPKNVYEHNAEIYKLLANSKRLEILNILTVQPATLTELTKIVGASKTNISQHLAILRQLHLVAMINRSGEAVYSIVDPKIVAPCRIMKDLLVHTPTKQNDIQFGC